MNSPAGVPPPDIPGLRYVTKLGTGGYSEVYLYEQQRPRMNVAVKVLTRPDLTDEVRTQFTAEGDAMAALADHPSIVQVFSADISSDGRPYLVMKYYPNPNLGVRARSERLSIAEALRIGIEISSAVETAHQAGILHRDIKPANILISQFGAAGLTDFGIAASTLDAAGADGLSVPWSPPEVLFSHTAPDVRADVYSLAATVWHLLVGRSPFEVPGGDNQGVTLMRRILDQPAPRTGRTDVPDSLERLLQQAMAKPPTARPPSALAFARGLQAVEQEQRLPLTPIIVPPTRHPSARAAYRDTGAAEDEQTRMKAPSRAETLAGAAPGVRPMRKQAAPNSSRRSPAGATNTVDRLAGLNMRIFLAGVLVAALLVGVIVAFATRHRDGGGLRTSRGTSSGLTLPRPQVRTVRAGTDHVEFLWTWPSVDYSIYAQWSTVRDGGAHHGRRYSAQTAQLFLTTAVAAQCIVVTFASTTKPVASAPSEEICAP